MEGEVVSGLNWVMPNGALAPGKVFPPPSVPMKGSTLRVSVWACAGRVRAARIAPAVSATPRLAEARHPPERGVAEV